MRANREAVHNKIQAVIFCYNGVVAEEIRKYATEVCNWKKSKVRVFSGIEAARTGGISKISGDAELQSSSLVTSKSSTAQSCDPGC